MLLIINCVIYLFSPYQLLFVICKQLSKNNKLEYFAIYGLETVVSVLFSNTRTRLLYNEREIFNTALSFASCSIEN